MKNGGLKKLNVAVFFGGKSVESEVSVITGNQVLHSLCKAKYNVIPIYIDKANNFYYSKQFFDINTFRTFAGASHKKGGIKMQQVLLVKNSPKTNLYVKHKNKLKPLSEIDVAVLATHGTYVEDGCLQGYLKMLGIPFTSSDTLGSALSMDKVVTKKLLKAEGIPVVEYTYFTKAEYSENKQNILENRISLDFPLIVKPANLGSSIGISKCNSAEELEKAIDVALSFDNKVIVEKAVSNLIELNCSVKGDSECAQSIQVSDIEQPVSWENFLSFSDKYLSASATAKGGSADVGVSARFEKSVGGATGAKESENTPKNAQKHTTMADKVVSNSSGMHSAKRIFPANISKEIEDKVKEISKNAFTLFNCKGVVRIDFLLDTDTNQIYLNEINTIPGSLAFYLWGKSFSAHLDELITLAIEHTKKHNQKVFEFKSDILAPSKF